MIGLIDLLQQPRPAPPLTPSTTTSARQRQLRERVLQACAPVADPILAAATPEQLEEEIDGLLGSEQLLEASRKVAEASPWEHLELGHPGDVFATVSPAHWASFEAVLSEAKLVEQSLPNYPTLMKQYGSLAKLSGLAIRQPQAPPPEVMELIFQHDRLVPLTLVALQAAWKPQNLPLWMRTCLLELLTKSFHARLVLLSSIGVPVSEALIKPEERLDLPRLYREMAETHQRWTEEAHAFARTRASLAAPMVWQPKRGDVVNVFAGGKPNRPGVVLQVDDGIVTVCLVAFGTGTSPEQRKIQGDPHEPNMPVAKDSPNGRALALDKDTWFYGHKDDRKQYDPEDKATITPRPGAQRCPDVLLNKLIKLHKSS